MWNHEDWYNVNSTHFLKKVSWVKQEQDFGSDQGSIKNKFIVFVSSVRTLMRGK